MSDKRYQVFISSTYKDLIEERRAVEQTVIRAGDFPVGMEAFPAADEEQFEFIKTLIAQCDYYILIIAGKYGSLADNAVSYTEKEHDYAKEIGVPVLVMLRDGLDELPVKDTETDPERREKLEAFIQKASQSRLRSTWKNPDALKLAVREALDHAKATKTRPGWVRGDKPVANETLERLVALQAENRQLLSENTQLRQELKPLAGVPKNIAGLDCQTKISVSFKVPGAWGMETKNMTINADFGGIFALLSPSLLAPKIEHIVKSDLSQSICKKYGRLQKDALSPEIDQHDFYTLRIQFMALGLIELSSQAKGSGGSGLYWSLTEAGRQQMLRSTVVTKG
ncbi:DUF4062 domain-containing protein [Sedimentimonas flavescens]|uniref:DUF4062 domain-containing protein n=1 Tax=Sedimentimonas flavescens TaxID=2851012 RepID=UPI0021A61F4C|nr:DUF4062 domain-containing protein [Sedimentimonas flavescens]MCT2541087.1 DUF4062 domain-containing protein [Sedimentimonas flavescens]